VRPSRHHRLNAYWKCILVGDAAPLGVINDWWWRLDDQQRGSLHAHIMVFGPLGESLLKLLWSSTSQADGRRKVMAWYDARITGMMEDCLPGFSEDGVPRSQQAAPAAAVSAAAAPPAAAPASAAPAAAAADAQGAEARQPAAFSNAQPHLVSAAAWAAAVAGTAPPPPPFTFSAHPTDPPDPTISEADHPCRRRAPSGPLWRAAARADFRALQRACVFHKCTFTCFKNNKSRTGRGCAPVHPCGNLVYCPQQRRRRQCPVMLRRALSSPPAAEAPANAAARPCRFHFPRKPALENTELKEEVTHGRERLKIHGRHNHTRLNPVSPQCMRTWRGNMDAQLITEPRGAALYVSKIAFYATRASKPDKDLLRTKLTAALNKHKDSPAATKLRAVAMAAAATTQTTAQHAAFGLIGGSFVECSREFVHVNLFPVMYRATSVSAAAMGAASAATGEAPIGRYSQAALLRHYHERPAGWENMFLHYFLSWFTATNAGKVQDMEGLRVKLKSGIYVRKFERQRVVHSFPYITADPTDSRSAWAALLLFRPHRTVDELLVVNGQRHPDAPSALAAALTAGLLDPTGAELLQRKATTAEAAAAEEAADAEREAGAAGDADLQELYSAFEDAAGGDLAGGDAAAADPAALSEERGSATRGSAGIVFFEPPAMKKLASFLPEQRAAFKQQQQLYLASFDAQGDAAAVAAAGPFARSAHERKLEELVGTLNAEQKEAYDEVTSHVGSKVPGAGSAAFPAAAATTATTGTGEEPPIMLRAFISGEGGTGKTHLIDACSLWCMLEHGSKSVAKMAWQNTAAHIINGVTISAFWGLGCRKTFAWTKNDSERRWETSEVKKRLLGVKLIIIDEVGVVAAEALGLLIMVYRKAFPEYGGENAPPFAGVHVMLCGDFYQLPPIAGKLLYEDVEGTATQTARIGRQFFRDDINVFVELTQNYRHRNDPRYSAIVSNARIGIAPSPEDLAWLNTRVFSIDRVLDPKSGLGLDAQSALWTAPGWSDVDSLNDRARSALQARCALTAATRCG